MITVPATVGVKMRRNRGQAQRERELEQGRDHDQRREHGRPALGDRRDADRDEGARGSHQQDVAGADAAEPHRLQYRRCTADDNGGEDRPGHEIRRAAGRPDHDDRRKHHASDGEHGELCAEAYGQGYRRILVGLVANARACVAAPGVVHPRIPFLPLSDRMPGFAPRGQPIFRRASLVRSSPAPAVAWASRSIQC